MLLLSPHLCSLQPRAEIDVALQCQRCHKSIHAFCAANEPSQAPFLGQLNSPESIRICYNCLKPGESPNDEGNSLSENGQPTKRRRIADEERESKTTTDSDTPLSMADLDWQTLLKPHPSIHSLVQTNKVCAPQITKKTIWWRLYHTWNMDDFGSEVSQPLAYCNLCGKVIKLSKVDRSPTPLKRHLEILHKEIFKVLIAQKLKDGPVLSPRGSTHTDHPHKTKGRKEITRTSQLKAITQWIIDTDQQIDVVESDTFRRMTSVLVHNPRHSNVFDKNDVVDFMSDLALAMRNKMKLLLANQDLVHVQEHWTASNHSSYYVDRVYWIDIDFKVQSLVVACDVKTEIAPHKPANILWESIGVSIKEQVRVVVRNCKNSDKSDRTGESLIYNGVENDLNQIAEIAYTALSSNINGIVTKVREIVEKVNLTLTMKELLLTAQKDLSSFFPEDHVPLPLIQDIRPDCWWSTNEMIGRFLYLRKALEYITLDSRLAGQIELLSKLEWDALEMLTQVWEPFSIASQLLQKQRYATIGLVPMILQMVGEDLCANTNQGEMQLCMDKMLTVWQEKFGKAFPTDPFHGLPKFVWVAHALDPRFKSLDVFQATRTSNDVIFDAVLTEMIALTVEERNTQDNIAPNKGPIENVEFHPKDIAPTTELRALASSRLLGTKRGLNRLSERLVSSASKSKKSDTMHHQEDSKIWEACHAELTAYRTTEGMKVWIEHDDGSKDFEDPLLWWKVHHTDFPTLWKLARRYLPIPATCATSDRAFDAEVHIMLAKRCKAQESSTEVMKLLQENSELLHDIMEHSESQSTTGEDKIDSTDTAASQGIVYGNDSSS